MNSFIVSARKYRPQTFVDVVGQKAITDTLENAIANDHLAQALLFTGPRGVGKTTCARILARKINEKTTPDSQDNDFSFNIFELDAASNNSVEGIRSLIEQVRIPPQVGKYKVYIIDEVHMLSSSAFNAFLKTLEEPPAHAIFILATTEKHKIIPTILSRCQIFDFKRITVSDAREYLKYIAKEEAVSEILNVLDYDTFFKITDLILANNIPDLLVEFNSILSHGFDGQHFIAGLAGHFRDLMVCKNEKTIPLMELGEETKKKYATQTAQCDFPFLVKALEITSDCDLKYKTSRMPRLLVELTLMQLASLTFEGDKKKMMDI